jgi:hypothetical protein
VPPRKLNDYRLVRHIAAILETRESFRGDDRYWADVVLDRLAAAMARRYAEDDPEFDTESFMRRCGAEVVDA